MDKRLIKELTEETSIEDVPERYRQLAELIGVENLVKLADYMNGDMMYIPRADGLLTAARRRRIKAEFDGGNRAELAQKYDMTPRQIANILKECDIVGQTDIYDIWGDLLAQ